MAGSPRGTTVDTVLAMSEYSIRRNKIAIVGAGSVGATLAYASLIRGVAHDVVLYDMNAHKVEAEVLDLRHGLLFCPPANVDGSDDVAICAGADVIAITAGAKQKPGQTRLELAGTNVEICRALVPSLLEVAPDAVLLMVTNPVDVLTLAALKFSGLPKNRVLGSGTVLDSARLRDLIARYLGVASQSVHAWIAGEHGDSEFPLWSTATIGSLPVQEFSMPDGSRLDLANEERIAKEVVTAAERIIRGKGATNYAVGLAANRVIEAILRDENGVLPVSSLVDDRYGLGDVCLSLPSLVNKSGVAAVLDVPMSDRERELLKISAGEVRAVAASLGL
jgi:L-lactate dehydrogenase